MNLFDRIPLSGRGFIKLLIGLASVVLWLFAVHGSMIEPCPLLDFERFFSFMRFLLKRAWLVVIVLGGVAYKEQVLKQKFEWMFVALLSLNIIPVVFPVFPQHFKTFIPLFRVMLPWLVAVYVFVWMLPRKADVFFQSLATRKSISFLIFVVLFFYYVFVGFLIFNVKGMRAGDEAHYMMMTKSLAEDGDLDLKNNYENFTWNKDFFVHHHLGLNSRAGKAYSTHPFGISLLLAPSYYLAKSQGVVIFLAFLSAFIGPLLFHVLRRETKNAVLRIAVTFLFCVPLPFCIYAARPYPELLTAISGLLGYYVIVCRKSNRSILYVAAGCVVGYMSWLLVRRFVIPLVIIDVAAFIRFRRERNLRAAACFFLPQVAFIASLFVIDHYRFLCDGVLATEVVKREGLDIGGRTVPVSNAIRRLFTLSFKRLEPCLAMFLDKRFGLIWTNPFVVFMMPALLVALFIRFKQNWHSLLIVWGQIFLVGAAGLCGWDAGVCHQPRYIVPVLPFIAIPCVYLIERGLGSQKLKLGGGIWVSIVLSFVSLVALLRIPFRFDTTFIAFSTLCPPVTDIQFCLPWFRSQFYSDGVIDHYFIWLVATVLTVVSLLFWSNFRQQINRPVAFMVLAFSSMFIEWVT